MYRVAAVDFLALWLDFFTRPRRALLLLSAVFIGGGAVFLVVGVDAIAAGNRTGVGLIGYSAGVIGVGSLIFWRWLRHRRGG